MGWNSWNSGIELTEQSVKQTIDAMVSSGMRDAGYRYVNLDAGWAAPTRDADGNLRADPDRFPAGIADIAKYAHDREMYLGIYHSPFNEGCGQDPRIGGAGHEVADARMFADWGVDYLKYDWCRLAAGHGDQVKYFTKMRDALRATGRHIFYSINPNSSGDPGAGSKYNWSKIADMNRNTVDLVPTWGDDALWAEGLAGVLQGAATAIPLAHNSSPSHLNDPDMMVIGIGWNQFVQTHPTMSLGPPQPDLSDIEQKAHFSLWAMLAAPLLAGNDIRSMSAQTRAVLTNRDVIAVDQDPLVVQGHPLPSDRRVWVKPLADGSVAVALTNVGGMAGDLSTTAAAVGLPQAGCYRMRDLWAHTETDGTGDIGPANIPSHGVSMFRVSTCS
jgi:alpha-galactosidase